MTPALLVCDTYMVSVWHLHDQYMIGA